MQHLKALVVQAALGFLIEILTTGMLVGAAAKEAAWARVTEDDRAIKVETDKLEAVIPKGSPSNG